MFEEETLRISASFDDISFMHSGEECSLNASAGNPVTGKTSLIKANNYSFGKSFTWSIPLKPSFLSLVTC